MLRARLDAEPDLLPPGYRLEYGGDADARADTVNYLMATVLMVVVLTLATLVLSFRSFRLTAIALVVAGLSMGLSVLALAVFGYPFGIQGLLGVIGSIGVSINAAIIILSALAEDPRAKAGDQERSGRWCWGRAGTSCRQRSPRSAASCRSSSPAAASGRRSRWRWRAACCCRRSSRSTSLRRCSRCSTGTARSRARLAGHASEALPGLGAGRPVLFSNHPHQE